MASPLLEKSHGWFRTWFRKVWEVRGGGLYACGFAVTFVIFEIGSLADDVLGVAFWLFPAYAKPHVEKWLFDEEPNEAE